MLKSENAAAMNQLKCVQEDAEIWRQASLKNTLGQMNITILCPRAECTVNGERFEMDSWNPTQLQADFERDVLPRFARLFVEDTICDDTRARPSRSEAVERTMKDFVDVF